jgi:hypothetical protein
MRLGVGTNSRWQQKHPPGLAARKACYSLILSQFHWCEPKSFMRTLGGIANIQACSEGVPKKGVYARSNTM